MFCSCGLIRMNDWSVAGVEMVILRNPNHGPLSNIISLSAKSPLWTVHSAVSRNRPQRCLSAGFPPSGNWPQRPSLHCISDQPAASVPFHQVKSTSLAGKMKLGPRHRRALLSIARGPVRPYRAKRAVGLALADCACRAEGELTCPRGGARPPARASERASKPASERESELR